MEDAPAIELDGVSKRFGGVTALDRVSFAIRRGEVHAVVGENGAGKSTLMKLLAGIHAPDAGEIRVEGRRARFRNPRDARDHGISIVFQELNLFPHRTIAANVFANRELRSRCGWVRRGAMSETTRQVLADLDLRLSPETRVSSLELGEKQLVEIARTLAQKSRIVILDEPNSALNEAESRRLFDIIRGLRARDITIVYVSHRLDEVFAIADRITVLRDGTHQGTYATADVSIPGIIRAMVGRSLDHLFPERPTEPAFGPVVLQVHELSRAGKFGPISFKARAGEVMGFAGLEGSGVDDLFRVLFGLDSPTSGQIRVRNEVYEPASPRDAVRRGWAMIPENRREQGLMMDWSIARNAIFLVVDTLLNRLQLIDRRAVRRQAETSVIQLGIVCRGVSQSVAQLSGGNQQKVLLGKWLATGPDILILNNPTRGVDVSAKWEIHRLCHQLTAQGMTILMTSSDADETLAMADRLLVFSGGRMGVECRRGEATKTELLHAMSRQSERER